MKVNELRNKFPKGTVIQLDHMDDPYGQAPADGTLGIVEFVDDAGQIHMKWETGCGLAIIPEVDKFHKVITL